MLISFEGGDRCGKTTQIELLKRKMENYNPNIKVFTLKHPNRTTPSGKLIDEYLKKRLELGNEVVTLCLTSNLWETSEKISTLLNEGYTVLIDRYIHTNLAYSQIRGVELKKLYKMMEGIVQPDIVIYLKPADEANSSGRTDFGLERYETNEIQNQVTSNYDKLLFKNQGNDFKTLKINSSNSIDQVAENIWTGIKESI